MNSINLCTDNILSHLKNNEQRYVIQNYQGEILCISPEDCTASINITPVTHYFINIYNPQIKYGLCFTTYQAAELYMSSLENPKNCHIGMVQKNDYDIQMLSINEYGAMIEEELEFEEELGEIS